MKKGLIQVNIINYLFINRIYKITFNSYHIYIVIKDVSSENIQE